MFDSIVSSATDTASLQVSTTLLSIIVSLLLGLIVSITYLITTKRVNRSSNFALSLVILPTIVAVVILLVGGNIARAFSMAGVFTLVRFRSAPGDSKDISFVFLAMAIGLTAGMGYIIFGVFISFLLCLTIIVISKMGFGVSKEKEKMLKIIIPEDMNYQGAFDDLFSKYTKHAELQRVKTTNLGTLFELSYHIVMKDAVSEKEFIDELRCRNGNLNILLSIKENNSLQF